MRLECEKRVKEGCSLKLAWRKVAKMPMFVKTNASIDTRC